MRRDARLAPGRPRLVEEGTPIWDFDSPERTSPPRAPPAVSSGRGGSKGSCPTRLVIGGVDAMDVGEMAFEYTEDPPSPRVSSLHHRVPSLHHQVPSLHHQVPSPPLPSMDVDRPILAPLVVIDGANLAHAYADADLPSSPCAPDSRGIRAALDYFLSRGVRAVAVVPSRWTRVKPREGDPSRETAVMLTPHVEILRELAGRKLLCACPPGDDDDAYALQIARRANREGRGHVLSRDLFRDAA